MAASLTQTTPPDSTPVCPGGRLVFTCMTNLVSVFWRRFDQVLIREMNNMSRNNQIKDLLLNITNITNDTDYVITSTGTIESVTVSLNGTMIGCSEILDINRFMTVPINVKG